MDGRNPLRTSWDAPVNCGTSMVEPLMYYVVFRSQPKNPRLFENHKVVGISRGIEPFQGFWAVVQEFVRLSGVSNISLTGTKRIGLI